MWILLLRLCIIIKSLIMVGQHCSFCSRLLCLFLTFCVSMWIFGFIFLFLSKIIRILVGNALDLDIVFSNTVIFTIIIFLIHEYGRYFYLLWSSPISFMHRSCTTCHLLLGIFWCYNEQDFFLIFINIKLLVEGKSNESVCKS
jgi:hypothetical protein